MSVAFNRVSEDAAKNIQVNAGMIVKTFNPSNPAAPQDADIICATTGGITASCVPTFEDFGEDIDNCPNNTKEMKRITGYDCTLSFTALNIDEETIRFSLGAASRLGNEVVARMTIAGSDFQNIWFLSEKVNDTILAICLKNALSTGGFSLKTQKNGKGQLTVTLTGHTTLAEPEKVPMQFFLADVSDVDPQYES